MMVKPWKRRASSVRRISKRACKCGGAGVLYCFDTDRLLTTQVYDSYQEAADDAERADDVLVLPLLCQSVTA